MEEDFNFLLEANPEPVDAENIITFQNSQEEYDDNQFMYDITQPGVPYKGITQTYITQGPQYIQDANEKSKKKRNKKNKKSNSNVIFDKIDDDVDCNGKLDYDICPTTPVQISDLNTENPFPQVDHNLVNSEDVKGYYIKQFDISNPDHIYSSLSIGNDEKLKKEICDNLRVQRIKEKRQKEEEARIQQLEEEENKIQIRLSALQQQKYQKIIKNHEALRAKSQKALKQRQIIEEMKQKTAQSAMIRMETAEKRKLQIQQAQQEIAMQKAADEWLKRHFAQQAILQMERRQQRQLKILAEKEKESTLRVQKMKSDMMKKEQTRRSVMKKFYASYPAKP